MMKKIPSHFDYDAAIVGAGPAGATAAWTLAEKGYKVALVDKEKFPRKKLCGGCLTAKTLRLLNRVFRETQESLTQKNIIDYQAHEYEIRCKTKPLIRKPSAFTFCFADRAVYDAFFLQKAKKAGAHVMEGEKIIAVRWQDEKKQFTLTTPAGRTVTAKFVIGADGVNSILRKTFFQQSKRSSRKWHRGLAHCLEVFPDRQGTLQNLDYPILSFGYLPRGYAWIFPNKNRLVAGIGGVQRKNKTLTAAFRAFINDFHLKDTAAAKTQPRGHPMPCGNFMKKPVQGNLILAGDAAGMVDPMLGEGIYQAHKSGELAAQAIMENLENNTATETAYLDLLHTHLLPEFIYARKWQRFVYNPLNHLLKFHSAKMVDRYFDRLVELIHGDRTYRWFKKKRNFFG